MSVGNTIKALDMKTIQNLEFYIPADAENGNTMLTVTSDVNLSGVTVKAGVDGNNKNLKVNDTVNLIVADGAKITDFDSTKAGKLDVDGFATFGLSIDVQNDNVLQATITESPNKGDDPQPDPINHDAAKSPVETRAAVATILNIGADMLSTAGFDNAASAVASEVKAGGSANVMTPFMAMGGTKAKIKSGSHVDVKGWNMNLGLAKEIDNKAGKLLIGPVVEYGRGSYDSYVNDVHGEGDSQFWGAGVMAKQTNDSGFYYEGSLRAGEASSDYQNKAVAGHSYDSDAAYWAAHVGVGKIVKLGDKDNLDYYDKFFYSHQKGDDVTTKSGTDLHFDATKSVRTRLGMRLNHEMDAKNALYAGLAWQREFDGDATATITVLGNNYSTPAPSIKGNTGIMELGWKINANKKLDLDLGATGYIGKQKGASLNLALNFKF